MREAIVIHKGPTEGVRRDRGDDRHQQQHNNVLDESCARVVGRERWRQSVVARRHETTLFSSRRATVLYARAALSIIDKVYGD